MMRAFERGGNAGSNTARWVDAEKMYWCSEHVGDRPARKVYLREYAAFFGLPFAELIGWYRGFFWLADRLRPFS